MYLILFGAPSRYNFKDYGTNEEQKTFEESLKLEDDDKEDSQSEEEEEKLGIKREHEFYNC